MSTASEMDQFTPPTTTEAGGRPLPASDPDTVVARVAAPLLDNTARTVTWIAPREGRHHRVVRCTADGHADLRVSGQDMEATGVPGLDDVLAGTVATPVHGDLLTPAPQWLAGARAEELHASLVVPLVGQEQSLGVLVLLGEQCQAERWTGPDAAAVTARARKAELLLEAVQLRQSLLAASREIGAGLDTVHERRVLGVDVQVRWRPADAGRGLGVGGDFYAFLPRPTGVTLAVGDVCGSDTVAALRALRVRGQLEALALTTRDDAELIDRLNRLCPTGPPAEFYALSLIHIAESSGPETRILLHQLGMPDAQIVHPDARLTRSPARGTVLGVADDLAYTPHDLTLAPGDTLVVSTDGLVEARNPGGDMLPTAYIERCLRRCAQAPGSVVADQLLMLMRQWLGGEDHDDTTLAVVHAPRPHSPDPKGAS
ncbi:PP2C family protein-serine/threonine phosphatase [Streptomyces sp. NPDC090106]|uniref:PP2C family protein-serine/threonine phosphatase n=1 Tax=Streptomyces sp. NPDC090106 TaxID=3365946 RepID=UPI00381775F4